MPGCLLGFGDCVIFVGRIKNILWQDIVCVFFFLNPLKWEFFLSDKPHSLLWAALCLSSNLDSLFASPDNCGGTFLQSQQFAGMGKTF